jgi:hypothetical protein
VIRKQIGYGPLGAEHAEEFQKFCTAQMNPYLNFHRPCGFAAVRTGGRGRRQRSYLHQDYRTPYEKLGSLPGWQTYLKQGIDAAQLDRQARRMSDTEAVQQMQKAKLELLRGGRGRRASQ